MRAAMFSVLGLSVLLARKKRRSKVADDLEVQQEVLKNAFSEEMQNLINEEMEMRQSKELWALLEPYRVPRDHILLEDQIGEGAMAQVWRGTCRGHTVAAKRLLDDSVNERTMRIFRDECNLLAQLQRDGVSHKNLTQMLFCCWDRELLLLIEFAKLGSLDILLASSLVEHASLVNELTWQCTDDGDGGILSKVAHGIASGMEYMHSRNPMIIHRDLKPANILIAGEKDAPPSEWVPKISDFGESRTLEEGDNLTMVGTPFFCCPEIILCEEYDEKADVYSFGVLLYDMAAFSKGGIAHAKWGSKPFSQVNVVRGMRPDALRDIPTWLAKIMQACWGSNPEARPPFERLSRIFEDHACNANPKKSSIKIVAFKNCPRMNTKKKRTSFIGNAFSFIDSSGKAGASSDLVASMEKINKFRTFAKSKTMSLHRPEARPQTDRMKRAVHTIKVLGYGTLHSLFLVIFLSVMSVNGTFLTDTFTKSDGSVITNFPILDTSQDYINFISWEMAAFGLAYVCNVAQRPAEVDDTAGPKGALAMLIILPVVMLLFYFLWNALRSLFDLRYYYAHAITTAAFVLSSMYASRYVRKRMRRSSTEKTTAKKAHSRVLFVIRHDCNVIVVYYILFFCPAVLL